MARRACAPQVKGAQSADLYSAAGGTISFTRLPFSNGVPARTSAACSRAASEPETRRPSPVVLRLNSDQVWPAGHRRAVGAQVVGSSGTGGEGDIEDVTSGLRAQNVHRSVVGRDVEQVPVERERGAQGNGVAVERNGGCNLVDYVELDDAGQIRRDDVSPGAVGSNQQLQRRKRTLSE